MTSKRKRFSIMMRDSFTCRYCGRTAPDVALEVDHRQPRSRGGSDDADNLVTACYDCNRGKGSTVLPTALEQATADAYLVRMRWLADAMDTTGITDWGDDGYLLIRYVMDSPGRHLVRAVDAMREATADAVVAGPAIVRIMLDAMQKARHEEREAAHG